MNNYQLQGDRVSHVHGSIIGGIFGGKVSTSQGNYYIERADFYFSEVQAFHSIIYREDDVVHNPHK